MPSPTLAISEQCGMAPFCGPSGPHTNVQKKKKTMEDPQSLKSNEIAQRSFQPQQHLEGDTFNTCEGLSRMACMDGNSVVMLGKVVCRKRKKEGAAGGKK